MTSSPPSLDALWLATSQRLCDALAHELKGVLNGASLNLEVVRSRAAKADALATTAVTAASLAPFAEGAASQFESVIDLSTAWLAIARTPRTPVDVAAVVRSFVQLLTPIARARQHELRMDAAVGDLGTSSAEGNAVRLAIGATLLSAIEASTAVACVTQGECLVVTSLTDEALSPLHHPDIDALRTAGIEIRAARSAISITFPR